MRVPGLDKHQLTGAGFPVVIALGNQYRSRDTLPPADPVIPFPRTLCIKHPYRAGLAHALWQKRADQQVR